VVDSVTLSGKIKEILGEDNNLPDDYSDVLENILQGQEYVTIKNDEEDYKSLSDVEIQEIIEKLNTYITENGATASPDELQTIFKITQALHDYILTDNDGDGDKSDFEIEGNDRVDSSKYKGDYFDNRARQAHRLIPENLNPNDDTVTDIEKWLDSTVHEVGSEDGTTILEQWFPNLSTEQQIIVLDYYKNSDVVNDTNHFSSVLNMLNDFQKNAIKEKIDTDSGLSLELYDIDGTLNDNLKGFLNLLDTLPEQDDNGDDISPSESIKDFLGDISSEQKDEIFNALTDTNSAFYQSFDGDINDVMSFFWQYLSDAGSTEQKNFLEKITPYSPIHLSLMQTLNERDNDADDDLSTSEKRYWDNLQKLSDGITDGNLSGINLNIIFPDDDAEISASDVVDDIFGNVPDIIEDGTVSPKLGEFIASITNDSLDIESFITQLTDDELAEFSQGLFSDNSPILALLSQEGGNELVNSSFDSIFKALVNLESEKQKIFLQAINPDSLFFEYLQDLGFDEIASAIEDETLDDLNEEDIKDFLEHDILTVTKTWYGSEVSEDYLKDLSNATDSKEIDDILNKAEDEGVIESVLQAVASDNFTDGSPEFYSAFFKALKSDSEYADIFMESIKPNSNLGRTLMQLSDNKTVPFDDISYDIDNETGSLDFGSDERKLFNILSNRDTEGVTIFFNTLETIHDEYDDAVGADNRGIKKLIDNAQIKNLEDSVFDEIFASIDDDTSNAEDMLSIIADDKNIIFKDLGEEQLAYFLDKFLAWIATQDSDDNNLLESFVSNLDEDSFFYKALIKAGGDSDDFYDGNYKDFIQSVTKTEDAARYIKQSLNFSSGENEGLEFISEYLRGKKGSEIDDAVADIMDYATTSPDILEDLINEVISGGDVITGLDEEQAQALIKAVFSYVIDTKPEEGEEISEISLLFLESIPENSLIYAEIQKNYPAISNYLGILSNNQSPEDNPDKTEDYDDSDITKELKKLLSNDDLIEAYAKKSNAQNETVNNTNNTTSQNPQLIEDDDETKTSSEANSSNISNTSEKQEFKKATDAALAALGKTLNVTGEPDYETGIFSSFFFEDNSVEDLVNAAIDGKFNTQEVIGTLQLIPLDKQPDFIREYIASGSVPSETQDYLLGRLLIMITNKEVGDRTAEKILEDAGITDLTYDKVTEILDAWSEATDKYTDASVTTIDDTYEIVLNAYEHLNTEAEENETLSDDNGKNSNIDNNSNNMGMNAGMMGGYNPYVMTGMGMGMNAGMMGGYNPYVMTGMGMGMGMMGGYNPYGMTGMGMMGGYNALSLSPPNPYQAGFEAGVYQAGFNAGYNNASGGSASVSSPRDIVINVSDKASDVAVNVSPDGNIAISRSNTNNTYTTPTGEQPTTTNNKEAIKARRQKDA
jgi:hypothetical protein